MGELIINMCTILKYIKGFMVGYGTKSNDQMMIDFKGKRYMVTFEELCDANEEDMIATMNKYWKN